MLNEVRITASFEIKEGVARIRFPDGTYSAELNSILEALLEKENARKDGRITAAEAYLLEGEICNIGIAVRFPFEPTIQYEKVN